VRTAWFIVLTLILGAVPALSLGFPGWQKHAPPPKQPSPPNSAFVNRQPGPPLGGSSSRGNPQPAAPAPKASSPFVLNGPGPHKGDWLRKYFSLPPSQQEQKLRQDPTFHSLPPDRQQHLLDRLRKFNSQPPEKKQQILNRMETYEHMTPQQQVTAQNLFQRYHGLPEDRRAQVSQEYRRLRGMPPEQRAQVMNSDDFRNRFSEDERNLLRGMTDLNVGPSHPE
jgi:hypothetical protein